MPIELTMRMKCPEDAPEKPVTILINGNVDKTFQLSETWKAYELLRPREYLIQYNTEIRFIMELMDKNSSFDVKKIVVASW